AMLVTFVLALVVPLQQAIILGVVVASVLFIYRASIDVRVVRLRREAGSIVEGEPPAELSDGETVILDVNGSLFFAGARTLANLLPKVGAARSVAVVLRLKNQGDVGSTLLSVLNTYAARLNAQGGMLILTGIDPTVRDRMISLNQVEGIGADRIFASTHIRHQSLRAAEAAVEQWREATPGV
ncbi:MAG TPA: STAS domain-containing protein, partial [Thermomicrobiales bacterium]|nr:STAS domain-containing protein [Thermomicrobiales bacterium]